MTGPSLPEEIQDVCQALVHGLKSALGEKLYAVYLCGAAAFPEEGPTPDIDLHILLSEAPDSDQKARVNELHATLARDFPPSGGELDAYYILLQDARQTAPPQHQLLPHVKDESWALHREHLRAGRCIVLYGPDPRLVVPAATWKELVGALQNEFDFVARHLEEYPEYCVLNLCRMVYSYATREVVVSKRASAQWFQRTFPEWSSVIDAARRFYDRQMAAQDQQLLKSTVRDFFAFASERIRETEFSAFIVDWSMDDYAELKRKLAERSFHFAKQADAEHIRVLVPLERVSEFAALCQPHLNAPFNYIDIQYPQEKRTVLIFQQQHFIVSSEAENERAKAWAIALGLPPQQADWGTSF